MLSLILLLFLKPVVVLFPIKFVIIVFFLLSCLLCLSAVAVCAAPMLVVGVVLMFVVLMFAVCCCHFCFCCCRCHQPIPQNGSIAGGFGSRSICTHVRKICHIVMISVFFQIWVFHCILFDVNKVCFQTDDKGQESLFFVFTDGILPDLKIGGIC